MDGMEKLEQSIEKAAVIQTGPRTVAGGRVSSSGHQRHDEAQKKRGSRLKTRKEVKSKPRRKRVLTLTISSTTKESLSEDVDFATREMRLRCLHGKGGGGSRPLSRRTGRKNSFRH